jgi:hypothetical protein
LKGFDENGVLGDEAKEEERHKAQGRRKEQGTGNKLIVHATFKGPTLYNFRTLGF